LIIISITMIATPLLTPSMLYAQQPQQSQQTPPQASQSTDPLVGFSMRGYQTNMPQEREILRAVPPNYYDSSFRAFSQNNLELVRYLVVWEAYERDRNAFANELRSVVEAADKWGVKVIYTIDQYRTSSWLDPERGYGFPASLFEGGQKEYSKGAGGGPGDESAREWWTDWFNRAVTNDEGVDGWTLQAQFLKAFARAVDANPSTLGYELLNEPRIYSIDQWEKVGTYNTFLTNELREVTQKLIVYDRQASPELDGDLAITPENMAKMAPANKQNVLFKATLFGLPEPGTIFEERMDYYIEAARIAGVPICFCEYNIKQYDDESIPDLSQQNVDYFFERFINEKLWGWALWVWDYKPRDNPNFVFVEFDNDGVMTTNDNFEYIRNANQRLIEDATTATGTNPSPSAVSTTLAGSAN
jgi:hypothetical protein